jgi:heme/copper-type cytochrome/quinol oxidase subunit 2
LFASIQDLYGSAEPAIDGDSLDVTAPPPPQSTKQAHQLEETPATPQELLRGGMDSTASISAIAWLIVIVFIVYLVVRFRRRTIGEKDEKPLV